MPPVKHLILVALFFLFGVLAMMAQDNSERLHWAALAIITFGCHGLLIVREGIRAGQLHMWTVVIHRHNQPQAFRTAAGFGIAGGILCLAGGLWVLKFL